MSEIDKKFSEFAERLGPACSAEQNTGDGVGRYREFDRGCIYWHPMTGAHAVHGIIGMKWAELSRERGRLGYPLTDEESLGENGDRVVRFQGGSIVWSPDRNECRVVEKTVTELDLRRGSSVEFGCENKRAIQTESMAVPAKQGIQFITCKEKAYAYVHYAAVSGAFLAPVPVPGMGTYGLIALESTLIYWIGKIYGETIDVKGIALIAGSLEFASLGVKFVLLEGLNFVPVWGWILKAPVAAGIVEGIGALAIKHFEDKYPGKTYTVDPDVEAQTKKK